MELIGICRWCSGSPHLCVGTDLATEHSAWPALPTPHKLCTNPISDIHCYYYYLAVWEFFWSMPASTTLCLRTRPSHLYDKLLEVCVTERVSKYARVLVREYMCVHACIALNYIINGQHLVIGCSRASQVLISSRYFLAEIWNLFWTNSNWLIYATKI